MAYNSGGETGGISMRLYGLLPQGSASGGEAKEGKEDDDDDIQLESTGDLQEDTLRGCDKLEDMKLRGLITSAEERRRKRLLMLYFECESACPYDEDDETETIASVIANTGIREFIMCLWQCVKRCLIRTETD
jgi:hypothetical protein